MLWNNNRRMSDEIGPESDMQSVLRSAADELTPVIVDLGPDQARFSSFIGSIDECNGGAIVLDSDPEAEYEEMVLKLLAPARALGGALRDASALPPRSPA